MDRIRGTTKFQELINDPDVEIVDICVPTPGHVDLTIEALKAGNDALVTEKARVLVAIVRAARAAR